MQYRIDKESKVAEGLVVVEFVNDNGIIEEVKEYMHIKDLKVFYNELPDIDEIDISKCYIECFNKNEIHKLIKDTADTGILSYRIIAKEAFINTIKKNVPCIDLSNEKISYVDFSETVFTGKAYFTESNFTRGANFVGAVFQKEAKFSKARFGEKSSYMGAHFFDRASFNKTTFVNDVQFHHCKFSKVNFDNAIFHKRASFNYAEFQDDFMIRDCICQYLDLTSIKSKNIIFQRSHSLMSIQIMNIHKAHIDGYINIDWKTSKVKNMICLQKKTTSTQKADQFYILKNSYKKLGNYSSEDKAYIMFRRLSNKGHYEDRKSKVIFKNILYCIKKWWNRIVYDFIFGYSLKPFNVVLFMLFVMGLFTCLYGMDFIKFAGQSNKFGSCPTQQFHLRLYYSFITFLTIGYGELNPANIETALLSGLEGFVGLILMGYFTVVITRKMR